MILLLFALFSLPVTIATIISDTGCLCATVKNNVTTPSASIAIGCFGQPKWCLTDQTNGPCGSLQSFGYADTCSVAGFTVGLSQPLLYTGQNLTVSWLSQNILPDEWIRISYGGTLLTKGQGTNVTLDNYTTMANVVAAAPVTVFAASSPQVATNTTQLVVLASGLSGPLVLNNGSVPSSPIPCDDRNITISWFATGQAGAGVTTVTVASTGGGGPTTVGTPVVQASVVGNNTVYYKLPRSFIPSSFRTYVPSISATNPNGGTPWVLTAAGFSLSAAPSMTPSSSGTSTPSKTPTPSISFGSTASGSITATPTPTQTPTPSLSFGATASVTPTQTPTPSQTGTVTPTPSQTETVSPTSSNSVTPTPAPTPSLNLAALNEAAAEAASNKTATLIGATIGGVVFLVVGGFVIHRVLERRRMRDQRLRRMKTFIRTTENAHTVYGMHHSVPIQRVRELRGKN